MDNQERVVGKSPDVETTAEGQNHNAESGDDAPDPVRLRTLHRVHTGLTILCQGH